MAVFVPQHFSKQFLALYLGVRFSGRFSVYQDFEESRLFGYYEYELICLAKNIISACERLFQLAPVSTNHTYEKCSNEAHFQINALLSEAAKIKKLVSPNISPDANLAVRKNKIKKDREAYFSTMLNQINLTEILKPKIRNTLEHFDEYLDEANIKLSTPENIQHDMAFSNLIISDWKHMPNKKVYPIRMYIANEKRFYNMKWSVDINKVYEESKAIQSYLRDNYHGADLLEEVGAMGLVLRS
ncbi:hypothetical protein [Candidatus Colwellia aromaticivorans]|uniref:hypothetical protein n=1 Tax=Candidatus Colwellia aromaticivorans TaxID=2267621 RepID=UPI000DF16892|nr:hypothetical protein [Candidatus Colwellia aromaticivorans]